MQVVVKTKQVFQKESGRQKIDEPKLISLQNQDQFQSKLTRNTLNTEYSAETKTITD